MGLGERTNGDALDRPHTIRNALMLFVMAASEHLAGWTFMHNILRLLRITDVANNTEPVTMACVPNNKAIAEVKLGTRGLQPPKEAQNGNQLLVPVQGEEQPKKGHGQAHPLIVTS
jgi:hypothetical protein